MEEKVMKKTLKGLLAAVFGALVLVAPASAQVSCTITQTGPGSNNGCTVNGGTTVSVQCTNSASISNVTNQSALSGQATVSGNTISGNAISGSADNITAAANALAQGCLAAAPAPTPTPTPGGGQGAGAPAPTKVAALPPTGETTAVEYALGSLAAVTGVGAIALAVRRALAA